MAIIEIGNVARNQPEALHDGINSALCRISLSVTLSVGDIHRIGKLPHSAIPLEAIFYPGVALNQSILKFGSSASQELFFASASFSATVRNTRALGTAQQISLSDDAMPRFEHITMVGTAGVSVGHVGDLVVYYKLPAQTL